MRRYVVAVIVVDHCSRENRVTKRRVWQNSREHWNGGRKEDWGGKDRKGECGGRYESLPATFDRIPNHPIYLPIASHHPRSAEAGFQIKDFFWLFDVTFGLVDLAFAFCVLTGQFGLHMQRPSLYRMRPSTPRGCDQHAVRSLIFHELSGFAARSL